MSFTFTIEVEAIARDADIAFVDMQFYHGECGGGRVKIHSSTPIPRDYSLTCRRCGVQVRIGVGENAAAQVILTAIDGRNRTFKATYEYDTQVLVRRRGNWE